MKKWILYLFVFLSLSALVVPAVSLYAIKAYRTWSTQLDERVGINQLMPVTVNGLDHWLLIRGHNRDNPVLLFLNGGPGESLFALSHEFFNEVEKHFTVVQVEAVGVGNASQNYEVGPDLQTVAAETVELILFITNKLAKERVSILGHSYGSAVGGLVVRDHPQLIDQFVSVGQMVDWPAGNLLAYNKLLERAAAEGNDQALEELAQIKPDLTSDDTQSMISFEDIAVQRKWLEHFGLFNVVRKHTPGVRWLAYLSSPNHSLQSSCRIAGSQIFFCPWVADKMWWQNWQNVFPDLIQFDAYHDIGQLSVPVTAIVGDTDWVTPAPLIKDYMQQLNAPLKNVVELEGTGHYPFLDDPQAFQNALIDTIVNVQQ